MPTYRDVLDPNDPYWPRVRRLHTYLWANGVLENTNLSLVVDAFLWLSVSIAGTILSLLWRIALLFVALLIVDWAVPGVASCITRESTGSVLPYFSFPDCTFIKESYLLALSAGSLIVVVIVLIYPIRRFLDKVFEIVLMFFSIVTLGYPIRFVAYLAKKDPNIAGNLLDKSYTFGPLSTAMELPAGYERERDRLWKAYRRSQIPSNEEDLEELLQEYEARYVE